MKKLRKSKENRMLTGVCGGIAETYDIDPALVRIGFGALSLFSGAGVVIYILAAIVMPEDDNNDVVDL